MLKCISPFSHSACRVRDSVLIARNLLCYQILQANYCMNVQDVNYQITYFHACRSEAVTRH